MNDRIYQAKLNHLETLQEDYEAAQKQLSTALDDVQKQRIKRTLKRLEEEINDLQKALGISSVKMAIDKKIPSALSASLPALLRIQLFKRDDQIEVRVLSAPSGSEPVEHTSYPYTFEQLQAILKALDVGRFDPKRFKTDYIETLKLLELLQDDYLHPDLSKIVGQKLFSTIFKGNIKTEYTLAKRSGSLACQIQFDAEDIILAQFPWETMHDGGNPLVPIQNGLELTRSIAHHEPPNPLKTNLPLRMLLVTPRPHDEADLGTIERKAIEDALSPLVKNKQIEVEVVEPSTWSALEELLLEKAFDILHFDGHGSFIRECPRCGQLHYPSSIECVGCQADMSSAMPKGYLHFEDEKHKRDAVSIDDMKVILANTGIHLVVLSACGSGVVRGASIFNGAAPGLIQSGIPAVVAMQGSPEVKTTAKFMQRMYQSITKGKRLPQAVNDGRRAVFRAKPTMWYMPVVYLRSVDSTLGQLFEFD